MIAGWVDEGEGGKLVVITDREAMGREIGMVICEPSLRIKVRERVEEGTGRGSDVLFTLREVESEGGVPREGELLLWTRGGVTLAGSCRAVVEDWKTMADAEGANMEVEWSGGQLEEDDGGDIFELFVTGCCVGSYGFWTRYFGYRGFLNN